MNKENSRSAAGLRRSAMAERIRLREEWSALKGITGDQNNVMKKTTNAIKIGTRRCLNPPLNNSDNRTKQARIVPNRGNQEAGDVLRGIVALVEVGSESKALPLRAALGALGASIVPSWTPLVTHVVWTQGGCRAVRGKARALACSLVSPLWVEACAAAARKLPEQAFPAAARPSDLPSPKTLRRLLIKADMENIPLADLLSDSREEDKENKIQKLRISSDTDPNTSADKSTDKSTDQSADTSLDTSHDKTKDKTAAVPAVNHLPRPHRPPASRRKLFTQKEPQDDSDVENNESSRDRQVAPQRTVSRRQLARAERLARRLANISTKQVSTLRENKLRIVLTGMSRSERHEACNAIRQLNGRIQSKVTCRTTHVLLGSCTEDQPQEKNQNTQHPEHFNIQDVVTNMNRLFQSPDNKVPCSVVKSLDRTVTTTTELVSRKTDKARTLNALLGAVKGCRVLYGQWALDSAQAKGWLHHYGYEVPHLKKICQKARVERSALGRTCHEYAYDVFCGMRVQISADADNRDAAKQLLQLCGAVVLEDNQNGVTQNGGLRSADVDVRLGLREGEISSKWVFDSVAAARMRTARRYVNKNVSLDAIEHIALSCQ